MTAQKTRTLTLSTLLGAMLLGSVAMAAPSDSVPPAGRLAS